MTRKQEIEEAERTHAALLEVVSEHLNSSGAGTEVPEKEISDTHLADAIFMHTFTFPEGVFAKANERKHLEEIRTLSRRLRSIYRELSDDIRTQLDLRGYLPHSFLQGRIDSKHAKGILLFLEYGPSLLDEIIPDLMELIEGGEQVGRRNYPAVRAVEACAHAWKNRFGTMPLSVSSLAFVAFVTDVFDALGVDASVEASIRSWREHDENSPAKKS